MIWLLSTTHSKLSACIVLFAQIGLLSGCGAANSSPKLHTTISADGEMVATLLNAGTNQQILRIRNLKKDEDWRRVEAPPLTRTIRFAGQGHELLLTYTRPQAGVAVLARLNLDQPNSNLEKIFELSNLAFPVEVSPGQVMVRTRSEPASDSKSKRFYLSGYHWILVGSGQQVQQVGPNPILPYPAPNIVGSGFFWTEEQIDGKKDAHPQVLAYPLPGGVAPDIPRERFEKNTWAVECDQKAIRCLRSYVTNRNQRPEGDFIYDVDVLFGSARCKLSGMAGFSDDISVTPDGNAAVMSLAPGYDKPRHVVVMRFTPKQCEAVSVQHIHFEKE